MKYCATRRYIVRTAVFVVLTGAALTGLSDAIAQTVGTTPTVTKSVYLTVANVPPRYELSSGAGKQAPDAR
jgi:hypothetical protein